LTAKIAEELWQAGFRDIDVHDKFYRTLLSKSILYRHDDFMRNIELQRWLVWRGAKIYSPMRCPDNLSEPRYDTTTLHPERRALHYIAADIGAMIPRRSESDENERRIESQEDWLKSLGEILAQFLTIIPCSSWLDDCICACSSGDCITFTILQKNIHCRQWPNYCNCAFSFNGWTTSFIVQATKTLLVLLGPQITCEDWLIDEIIRFNTFQELRLKHTCCERKKFVVTELESDEINELRNEDSEGIELLEELMIEFRNQRGSQSLMSFLQGYWITRMKEVQRTRDKVVDLEKSREIGIVWREKSKQVSRCTCAARYTSRSISSLPEDRLYKSRSTNKFFLQ
jgi:hypothetical protein